MAPVEVPPRLRTPPHSRNKICCTLLGIVCAMPVETARKVEALSRDFRSQRKLAEALGVSPAQVTRWRRGRGIDPRNAERVDMLELVMSVLLRLYEPEAAELWLRGTNPHLRDRRPIDLIRAGRVQDVLGAISAERAGSYA
jgi:uncharacterized protein (DUF2384 family)